jgi:hypothetical protein
MVAGEFTELIDAFLKTAAGWDLNLGKRQKVNPNFLNDRAGNS